MSDDQHEGRVYANQDRGLRRAMIGTVVSTKQAKTLTVSISRKEMHRKYKKYVERRSKVYAHDEQGEAQEGDMVKVVECRPMSRQKRFRLVEVVKKAGN